MPDIGLLLAERGGPNASPGFPFIFVSYRSVSVREFTLSFGTEFSISPLADGSRLCLGLSIWILPKF